MVDMKTVKSLNPPMQLCPRAHISTHFLSLSVTMWGPRLLCMTMWGSCLLSMMELAPPCVLIPKPPISKALIWQILLRSSSQVLPLLAYPQLKMFRLNLLVKKQFNKKKNFYLPNSNCSLPFIEMFLKRTGTLFHLILHHCSPHLNLASNPPVNWSSVTAILSRQLQPSSDQTSWALPTTDSFLKLSVVPREAVQHWLPRVWTVDPDGLGLNSSFALTCCVNLAIISLVLQN